MALMSWGQEYRFEVGPAIGVTGYLGDVNNTSITSEFRHIL